MANVVTGLRDAIDAAQQRFAWADPVFVAWLLTVVAVVGSAELFQEDYDMLMATMRILFYLTLFDLVIGIPDQRTDTPNTEQLFTILSALGAGGLGYSIEVTAGIVAGDMTAGQLLGLSMVISRTYANYTVTDQSLKESVFSDDPVTHPYTTTFAVLAVTIPFGLKLWVFLLGKSAAPDVHSASTYAAVTITSATIAFALYYLNNGLSWGEVTGNDAVEAAQAESSSTEQDTQGTDDPRRTGGGFEFPAGDESDGDTDASDENPVADHPVARQSREEQ